MLPYRTVDEAVADLSRRYKVAQEKRSEGFYGTHIQPYVDSASAYAKPYLDNAGKHLQGVSDAASKDPELKSTLTGAGLGALGGAGLGLTSTMTRRKQRIGDYFRNALVGGAAGGLAGSAAGWLSSSTNKTPNNDFALRQRVLDTNKKLDRGDSATHPVAGLAVIPNMARKGYDFLHNANQTGTAMGPQTMQGVEMAATTFAGGAPFAYSPEIVRGVGRMAGMGSRGVTPDELVHSIDPLTGSIKWSPPAGTANPFAGRSVLDASGKPFPVPRMAAPPAPAPTTPSAGSMPNTHWSSPATVHPTPTAAPAAAAAAPSVGKVDWKAFRSQAGSPQLIDDLRKGVHPPITGPVRVAGKAIPGTGFVGRTAGLGALSWWAGQDRSQSDLSHNSAVQDMSKLVPEMLGMARQQGGEAKALADSLSGQLPAPGSPGYVRGLTDAYNRLRLQLQIGTIEAPGPRPAAGAMGKTSAWTAPAIGASAGAGVGALYGATSSRQNRLRNALLGALGGAAVGSAGGFGYDAFTAETKDPPSPAGTWPPPYKNQVPQPKKTPKTQEVDAWNPASIARPRDSVVFAPALGGAVAGANAGVAYSALRDPFGRRPEGLLKSLRRPVGVGATAGATLAPLLSWLREPKYKPVGQP